MMARKDVVMTVRLEHYSYRFAEQVLNSRLSIKNEIEEVIRLSAIDLSILSRPVFNGILKEHFIERGWVSQPVSRSGNA
jgi:hypothetical protein